MQYKSTFNKKLQIASLESNDEIHNFKVHVLLQNCNQKQPSINAYLGARYSRSADSIVTIAKEIIDNNTDAASRLESIFHNYGHKSVGDMADVFVCLENVTQIFVHNFFYRNPIGAGQERSTRYQNFAEPNFIKLPKEFIKLENKNNSYEIIMNKWMKDYQELLDPTYEALKNHFKPKNDKNELSALQARAFDTVRYFLPLGLKTSFALLMPARKWAENISYLRASNNLAEKELAEILNSILTGTKELKSLGYKPEADGLISHTEANETIKNSTIEILKLFKKLKFGSININDQMVNNVSIIKNHDPYDDILIHYLLLLDPLAETKNIKFSKIVKEKISKIIFKYHNHHNQMGNIGQSGAILIDGIGDYGSVFKDLNRHRSLEKFSPIHEEFIDFDEELNRKNNKCYFLCDYLDIPELKNLKKEYQKRFNENYENIKLWRKQVKNKIPENIRNEYTRYLLPHGHATRYRIYGSFDDILYTIALRTRNGGHIAYRNLTYHWLLKLVKSDPLWKSMIKNIPEVKVDSREQFFDRS